MANHSTAETTHVKHHFVDSDQQFDTAKLGMWVFIVNEILFFGGLFCAYIVFRAWYPELFQQGALELNKVWGGLNTIVLIGSSITVAMGIRSIQLNQVKGLKINLLITIALACIFLLIKAFEYHHKFELGLYPGAYYNPTPEVAGHLTHPMASAFFSIYYMLTGVHAVHVIIGIGLMIWLYIRTSKNEFSDKYFTPVEIVGLYWHLVDIIWIFLFPLLYLIE